MKNNYHLILTLFLFAFCFSELSAYDYSPRPMGHTPVVAIEDSGNINGIETVAIHVGSRDNIMISVRIQAVYIYRNNDNYIVRSTASQYYNLSVGPLRTLPNIRTLPMRADHWQLYNRLIAQGFQLSEISVSLYVSPQYLRDTRHRSFLARPNRIP